MGQLNLYVKTIYPIDYARYRVSYRTYASTIILHENRCTHPTYMYGAMVLLPMTNLSQPPHNSIMTALLRADDIVHPNQSSEYCKTIVCSVRYPLGISTSAISQTMPAAAVKESYVRNLLQ